MAKYIDVERYCREVCRCAGLENGCDKSKCPIWNAPAEDVIPVVHGKWIPVSDDDQDEGEYYCSACFAPAYFPEEAHRKDDHCYFCGAKMDVIEVMETVAESAKITAESLKSVADAMENADRCICCGEIVPEGRQVCPGCETGGNFDG